MAIVRREIGLAPEDYRTDARLTEIHYGHWEGLLWSDLPAADPAGFAAREADRWNWRPDGGESYSDLYQRIAGWLKEIERSAVVVAHGGVMRVLRGLCLNLQPLEIFALDVPQDKVLVIQGAHTRWL
jgi:probable phosphoglycerate mutase